MRPHQKPKDGGLIKRPPSASKMGRNVRSNWSIIQDTALFPEKSSSNRAQQASTADCHPFLP